MRDFKELLYLSGESFSVKNGMMEGMDPCRIAPKKLSMRA
jgi:hypothetical protein